MKTKKYRVWIHFNRSNMQKGDPRVWSVHFRGTCYQVPAFSCTAQLTSSYKASGRQPRAVLKGWASELIFFSDKSVLVQ